MRSATHELSLSAREAEWKASGNAWHPFAIRTCSPRSLYKLVAHGSILSPATSPHDPHGHVEEELIIILSGSVRIIRTEQDGRTRISPPLSAPVHKPCDVSGGSPGALSRGAFAYHAAMRPHTIQNCGETPAAYICLKWVGRNTGKAGFLESADHVPEYRCDAAQEWTSRIVFESATQALNKLHCHTSVMKPGAGYDPHRDEHDVILILLDGEVETLGRRVSSDTVVYYHGGEAHGMRSVGSRAARYLVFEFHRKGWLFRHLPPPVKARLTKRN